MTYYVSYICLCFIYCAVRRILIQAINDWRGMTDESEFRIRNTGEKRESNIKITRMIYIKISSLRN
jgi:hypothetical protein